jgi:hypothetical protein
VVYGTIRQIAPDRVATSAAARFVTDTEKATWNAKQNSAPTLAGYGSQTQRFVDLGAGGTAHAVRDTLPATAARLTPIRQSSTASRRGQCLHPYPPAMEIFMFRDKHDK